LNRNQLEHLIRAAGTIADAKSIIVIGSQAILASLECPPVELAMSIEADLYPEDKPELADLIDGCIGELSPFHETFGYYAQGVGRDTAVLPTGWRDRLVPLENENTNGVRGLCLSPVDIVVSKIVAGREKDEVYVRAVFKYGILTLSEVGLFLGDLPRNDVDLLKARLERWSRVDDEG
jgi:hypothetical protein